ncbi:hypothetical protein BDZ97DRAFT_1763326 [Flammula alnicola]|nr:hypothetical protein BDZ97DRAFT_1763326 [Flammula alnicola]
MYYHVNRGETEYQYWPMDYDEAVPTTSILPSEVLEQVLSEAWLSVMSAEERKVVVTSISLVSKLWLAIFARISTRDIFILSSSSLDFYRRLLDGRSPSYWQHPLESRAADLCRSFTRQMPISTNKSYIYSNRSVFHSFECLRRKHMRDLLATFRLLPYLPNMRSMLVEYYYPGLGSKNATQFVSFNVPVVRLELEYTFSPDAPLWIIDELGLSGRTRRPKQRHVPWAPPDLEHISTTEDQSVAQLLQLCPHLELAVEEQFKIQVQILSSSRFVPTHCAIVHGAMAPSSCITTRREGCPPASRFWKVNSSDPAPRSVRGSALGFILDTATNAPQAPIVTAAKNRWRNVHVLVQRRGRC